jgi:1-deoxy-D-xylulose-5-phosphate reductoisomerase
MKKIALLGSTGSIGTQVADIVSRLPERLEIVSIAAHRNVELLAEQVNRFHPSFVAIGSEQDAARLRKLIADPSSIEIGWGTEGLTHAAAIAQADVTVVSVAGTVGLAPTIEAIKAGKEIALASKEVLVAAGSLVNKLIEKHNVRLLPVDSEHSAIFQCLHGEDRGSVRRLMLTASGGALKDFPIESLKDVTVKEALAHPNWSMGRKITVDSATLINKGLEIIEASWLFGIDVSRIDVVIHPQSIVHSMVEFDDGSVLAQLGVPDMRLPIQYALLYPERVDTNLPKLDIVKYGTLTFDTPDAERYPGLQLAYDAAACGGTMTAVMNAANEVAVGLFLDGRIGFLDIERTVRRVMDSHETIVEPDLDQILQADLWARSAASVNGGNN